MVLLTMTAPVVEALKLRQSTATDDAEAPDASAATASKEPSLEEPAVGKPISHGQIVDLWKSKVSDHSLEQLLRGSQVYIPPPPPKKEPVRLLLTVLTVNKVAHADYKSQTPEYKALMARLRREEEERSYSRMVNPPQVETFYQRYPHASARAFAMVNQPTSKEDFGDDDVTYNEIHRQLLLLFNFLVSIFGVAGTLWVAARWWSLPARLFLTMGGGLVVAIAEVAVYSIYVWKMGDAKGKQEAVKEVKEVVDTWVLGDKEEKEGKEVLIESKEEGADGVRKRAVKTNEGD